VELNAFQVLMRRWSRLHPYNAGQVMQVSGAPDRARWKAAVEAVIQELGLGKPRFSRNEHVVEYVPVAEVPVEETERELEAFFNDELNRPFEAGDVPIRFCILPVGEGAADAVEGNGGASHYFAAVYDHWIADSRAMRELMHRIYERYRHAGDPSAHPLPPLTLEAPPFKRLFAKHRGPLPPLTALRESLRSMWRHRNAYRLNLWEALEFKSRFLYRRLPDGLIDRLYTFAKARGASVNDLFIAVIGQTMGAYTAWDRLARKVKPLHFHRRKIGIGTIVDIRDAASEPLDRVFSLYLSSYTTVMHNPEQRPADDVTRQVAARTGQIKKTMGTVKSFWGLSFAKFWYGVIHSPRFHATMLHKRVSVVAGISNVNMTKSWVDTRRQREAGMGGQEDKPLVRDYLRISPTGPLIPLVFTLTTIGGRLSLCVTYRTTSMHPQDAEGIIADFVKRLEAVAAEGA
jgi:hypothetical protein